MKALDDVIMTLESGAMPNGEQMLALVTELGGDPEMFKAFQVYGGSAPFLDLLYINCLAVRKLRQEAIEE